MAVFQFYKKPQLIRLPDKHTVCLILMGVTLQDTIPLENEGETVTRHYIILFLNYGCTDNICIGTDTDLCKQIRDW